MKGVTIQQPATMACKNILCVLMIILFSAFMPAQVETLDTSEEIAHLLEFIKTSDCTFIRNGKVYSGKEGLEHIHKKYTYFKEKIKTTEDFIKYSATKSELSGKMYYVQLIDGKKVILQEWLLEELQRYRREAKG